MASAHTHLTITELGSFFVGGSLRRTRGEEPECLSVVPEGIPVVIDPNGSFHAGQMYVQFHRTGTEKTPVAFWHGGSLTGACWESTPDGRPGWQTYFLRSGRGTYVCDAVERGRSGWAPRLSEFAPVPFLRTTEDVVEQFRLGRVARDNDTPSVEQFAPSQFPWPALELCMRQVVPRWVGTEKLALAAYLEFLRTVEPVVLVAHSQGVGAGANVLVFGRFQNAHGLASDSTWR